MKEEKKRNERLQNLYNELADSVLELSDEAITGEVSETDVDPHDERESVRIVLRESSRQFDRVERCRISQPWSIRKMEASGR